MRKPLTALAATLALAAGIAACGGSEDQSTNVSDIAVDGCRVYQVITDEGTAGVYLEAGGNIVGNEDGTVAVRFNPTSAAMSDADCAAELAAELR